MKKTNFSQITERPRIINLSPHCDRDVNHPSQVRTPGLTKSCIAGTSRHPLPGIEFYIIYLPSHSNPSTFSARNCGEYFSHGKFTLQLNVFSDTCWYLINFCNVILKGTVHSIRLYILITIEWWYLQKEWRL